MVSTALRKAQMIHDLQATLTAQVGGAVEDKTRPNVFKSSLETIGYKAERYGRPGCNDRRELNSQGNEHFFRTTAPGGTRDERIRYVPIRRGNKCAPPAAARIASLH